ncbi:MAG: hypothetical protein FD123_1305 [Bacteroidetes bacterium]|nr:MAG: hypothetical protein FD123_1305 [Bacteroidota bacterium]
MSGDNVKFQIKGKSFEKSFDRSKIRLGAIFYVKEIDGGNDIEISEKVIAGGTKFAVSWIASSVWAVTLKDIYYLEYEQVLSTQRLLERYMTSQEVLDCISHKASKLRLEHLYKTSEFDKSSLRVIFAVAERLNFINSLKEEEISKKLFHHWEPVIVYHLLTCFDLLGQPHSWKTFDAWLTSSDNISERENVIAKIETKLSNVEFSKQLYLGYQNIYGTKNSFFRFIREILPAQNRQELLESIKIHTNSMPPLIEIISEDGTDLDKENFLYEMRNNYTHKAKVVHGIDFKSTFGIQNVSMTFSQRIQEFKATKWITYMTANWPDVLEHIVKIGLAETLKKDIANAQDYTKYSFKHKYYRAFKPDGTEKTGVNRILFDLKGEEITREYVPEGFPKEFEWATIAEIDKHNIMYPNKERQELIRPIDG